MDIGAGAATVAAAMAHALGADPVKWDNQTVLWDVEAEHWKLIA